MAYSHVKASKQKKKDYYNAYQREYQRTWIRIKRQKDKVYHEWWIQLLAIHV